MLVNTSITLPDAVLNQFPSRVFVETGAYDGRTIQQALDVGFEYVIAVELSRKYYQQCKDRFEQDPRVTLYHGDTVNVMPHILTILGEKATFWLDAHIQEGVCGVVPIPLMLELRMIQKHQINNHNILIDDVRLMGSKTWRYQARKEHVVDLLHQINSDYKVEYHNSKAADSDIISASVGD